MRPHRVFICIALGFLGAVVASEIPRYTVNVGRVEPDTFGVAIPDEDGPYVMFENVQAAIDAAVAEAMTNCPPATGGGATTIWFPLPLIPEQNEPNLLCEIKTGVYALRNYTSGQWRNGTSVTPAPLAWAKINPRTITP